MAETTGRLMTLEEAAATLHAAITVNTLRKAIRKGELDHVPLAGRYFVTSEFLERFLRCRARASRPASGSNEAKASGSSGTGQPTSGLDMALSSVERLRQPSKTTSPAGARQAGSG